MEKRLLSLLILFVFLFSLVSCAQPETTAPPETTAAPDTNGSDLPSEPSSEELLAGALLLKPEAAVPTAINVLCTQEACDALYVDDTQTDLGTFEAAVLERLSELQRRLNVTLAPFVPELREGESFWEAAVRCLSAADSDVDLIIGPSNEPIPAELFPLLSKLSDCRDPSGNEFFAYMPSDRLAENEYFVNGRLLSSYHGSALVTFLNHKLAGLSVGDPSELRQSVKDGSFTLDSLVALAKRKGLPIACKEDTLAATLSLAFGCEKEDAAVTEAIASLSAEGVLLDTDDPFKAFTEERALAVFMPISTPLGDAFSFTTALPLPKKDTAQETYRTGAPNGFDIIAVNQKSEKKALSAAAVLVLESLSGEDCQQAYFQDIYACRCLCESRKIWEETIKVCQEDCVFRKITLDK